MSTQLRIASQEALISAIENSDNEIALLIGSPLSSPAKKGEKGVPSVSGVLNIVEETVNDIGKSDLYHAQINGLNDNDKYQKSFTFLSDFTSPNTINNVIRKAVLQSSIEDQNFDVNDEEGLISLQNTPDAWSIPPATEALSKILSLNNNIQGPILTPNFDPLLSIALTKCNQEPCRTVLHSDSSLQQYQPNGHHIIHFHGFWLDTDTLHTPAQLGFDRPKLKASLASILKNKTVLVLGYGGWDDVVTQVLFDLMNDEQAKIDIIWTFFESSSDIINSKYEHLIKSVQPAIQRGRFRGYGGIDCHTFLPELHDNINKKLKDEETPSNDDGTELNQSSEDLFRDEDLMIPEWKVYAEVAHEYIRDTEKAQLSDILENDNCVNVVVDWGLAKNEFIGTFNKDINSPYYDVPIFRVDVGGVETKSELLDQIEQNYGFGLQALINNLPKKNFILYFDDIKTGIKEEKKQQFYDDIYSVISLVLDFHPQCKIILSSKKAIGGHFNAVHLSKLEEYDAKKYINNHSSRTEEFEEKVVESLIKISQGIPRMLDKYIDELSLLSINELLESHYTPESHLLDIDETVPVEVKKRIELLSSSSDFHSQTSFEMLKMLSILEHGDAFNNLKRAYNKSNFRTSHLKELYGLELIESVSVNKSFLQSAISGGSQKIYLLPSVVREYIYSHLTTEDIFEITKQIATVHLGKKWRESELNLNPIIKDLLKDDNKTIGSTNVLLIQMLRCALELNLGRDIEIVYKICLSYAWYLSSNSKYRELVSFADQVRAIASQSDKITNYSRLSVFEGQALRMTAQSPRAETVLNYAYDNISELSNSDKESLLINLAYLFEESDPTEAIKMCNELLDISPSDEGAKLLLTNLGGIKDISKLKALENDFRGAGKTTTANNAAIQLMELEVGYNPKIKWLNKVIKSENDSYNKYRAIAHKCNLMIKEQVVFEVTSRELALLHGCYNLGFNQKMNFFINSAHKGLWKYYIQENNLFIIFQLFKQSSLYWRIFDNKSLEETYSKKVLGLMNNLLPDSSVLSKSKYVTIRVKQITPSYS